MGEEFWTWFLIGLGGVLCVAKFVLDIEAAKQVRANQAKSILEREEW